MEVRKLYLSSEMLTARLPRGVQCSSLSVGGEIAVDKFTIPCKCSSLSTMIVVSPPL